MRTTQKRAPRVAGDVREEILKWATRGKTAGQIFEALYADHRFAGRVPTDRTVRRIVAEVSPPDPSGAWSLADDEPEDVVPVLDVLQAVITITDGRVSQVTRAEAAYVAKIHAAAPDLWPWGLYLLARSYVARAMTKQSTDDLDAYLAFRPWQALGQRVAYEYAVKQGSIKPAPYYLSEELTMRPEPSIEKDDRVSRVTSTMRLAGRVAADQRRTMPGTQQDPGV